jgi:hypothetical protein
MKKNLLRLIMLIVGLLLTYQMSIVNPVIAQQSPIEALNSPHYQYQLTPTVIPTPSIGDKVLTTDPILLQIIILLGIFAVLVIFIGVWINRRQINLK